MRSREDKAHPGIGASPPMGITPALARGTDQEPRRATQVEQLILPPQLGEMSQAAELIANTVKVRETKISTLQKVIASGQYEVKPEQVAERILKYYLLDLFYLYTNY